MAGYKGYSMSNNAVDAYNDGEKPLSKWTKADFVEHDERLKPFSVAFLRQKILYQSSWHHTSSHYNRTYFYSLIDREQYDIDKLTKKYIIYKERRAIETAERKAKAEKKEKLGFVPYAIVSKATWGGSRKHPRIEHFTDYVIDEDWRTEDGKKLRQANSDEIIHYFPKAEETKEETKKKKKK
ncbi:hypothetical protein [Pseudolactococcus insecticola]|uniref:Uncharacterized protein n=1 Tax=Pseudolactococcus insecticola TaxID=2709158 RepID=A0A6A0BAH9_9LACT|nr:hypothetical protein [Lactococcus insecticola]GFH41384.1 hypothetical protein Hs20B_17820 [Lactococcus insecticola]